MKMIGVSCKTIVAIEAEIQRTQRELAAARADVRRLRLDLGVLRLAVQCLLDPVDPQSPATRMFARDALARTDHSGNNGSGGYDAR